MLNFDFVFTVTKPNHEEWSGRKGRIDSELLKENVDLGSLFFLCGPLKFVKDIRVMLESLGVGKEQIKSDIWGE